MDGREKNGRFAPGNPGKPKGARHKATRAALKLLDGEAKAVTRKCIDRALEGEPTALRLCIERLAPVRKDTPVNFELPRIGSAREAANAAAAILDAVANAQLTPIEGAQVMGLVETFRRTLESSEFEQRIADIEKALDR